MLAVRGGMSTAAVVTTKGITYKILVSHDVADPAKTAMWFSTMLAADKGVGSKLVKVNRRTVDVVADDNRAVRFCRLAA